MKNEFRKKLLTQLGITIGVVVIIFVGIVFLQSHVRTNGDEIKRLKQEAAFHTQVIQSLTVLKELSEQVKVYENQLQNILPPQSSLFNFSKTLRTNAEQHNLSFAFQFGQESGGEGEVLRETAFQMTIAGNETDIISFFQELYQSSYLVEIPSLEFTRESAGSGKFRVQTSGIIFSQ